MEKAERVSEEDREQIRPELIRIAELLMERYNMSVKEISRYLHGMIDVSI